MVSYIVSQKVSFANTFLKKSCFFAKKHFTNRFIRPAPCHQMPFGEIP